MGSADGYALDTLRPELRKSVVEILQCGPNGVHEHDYVARDCSQMYFNHDTYGDGNCGCVTQFPRDCTLPANQESHPTALIYKLDAPMAVVTCTWDVDVDHSLTGCVASDDCQDHATESGAKNACGLLNECGGIVRTSTGR